MKNHTADDPADFSDRSKPSDATLRIGPHVFLVPRDEYEAWERNLLATTGASRPAIAAELRRRLGL